MAATRKSYSLPAGKKSGVFVSYQGLKFALLVGVLLTFVGIGIRLIRGTSLERGNALLLEAFGTRRLIEPRLSGGFKAALFVPAGGDENGLNKTKLDEAGDLIRDAVITGNPLAHLSYGRLLLSKNNKGSNTLKHLRLAVDRLPGNAEAHNDLGVCFMERGKTEDAITEFNTALEHKTDMPEALFNRALCYERLLLREAASEDYAKLNAIEQDAGWRDEIKQRYDRVSSTITPQKVEANIAGQFSAALASGNFEEANLITSGKLEILVKNASRICALDYLNELGAGNQEQARKTLYKMEWIGRRLIDIAGDSSITDLANYLRDLPAEERQEEINLLTEFFKGEKLPVVKGNPETIASNLRMIRRFTERGNTLFQFHAISRYANFDYNTGQFDSSLPKLNQALAIAEKNRWAYRKALILFQLGTVYSRIGQDSLTLKYCEQARKLVRDMPHTQGINMRVLASAYLNLGDMTNALACFHESNRLYLSSVPSFDDISNNYSSVADALSLQGNHSLALLFAKQALKFSESKAINNRLAQATAFIALEYAQLRQFNEAEEALKQAFDYLEKTEEGKRSYARGLILTCAGDLYSKKGEVERALEFYSKAEAVIEQSQEKIIPMIKVLRARAEAYVQARDFAKANADLGRAIGLIEQYRANISERKNRSDFLDASQGVFDDLILLNIQAFDNGIQSFNLSEQSRARSLLDDIYSGQGARPGQGEMSLKPPAPGKASDQQAINSLTLSEVQAALPDDLRLVTYSVTRQGTFIFLITRSGFEVRKSRATTEMLDQAVQDYLSGLKSMMPLDELSEKSRALYRHLIEPIDSQLGDKDLLCIVPDKALHFLPFASLRDSSDKYLIEKHRLTYAPSASVLAYCIQEAKKKGENLTEKMLAVGNPLFNTKEFPLLRDLPEAEREAKDSASLYSADSLVLNGPDATKARVRAALTNCEVAHFSLHCLVQQKSPWLAALLLADPGSGVKGQESSSTNQPSDNDGLLHLSEVYGMSLPRLKLVVLSACQSGLGQYYRGEGMVSLVRPFLALKVPTVVASLWSVDSQATAELMIDFHRQRKTKGSGAGDALHDAQVRMARGGPFQHPYYWASFIAVGSNK